MKKLLVFIVLLTVYVSRSQQELVEPIPTARTIAQNLLKNSVITLDGSTEWLKAVAIFSPDGKEVLTASADSNTAKVWATAKGNLLRTLTGHQGRINSLSFSRDGKKIVTSSDDNTAKIWDAASGNLLRTLVGHTKPVRSAVFSADGTKIVTASDDDTARVWMYETGQSLHIFYSFGTKSALFSPDDSTIAVAAWVAANTWNAQTGEDIHILTTGGAQVNSVIFSPDGSKIVTLSDDNLARIWDTVTGQTLNIFTCLADNIISSAIFSPDGSKLVTAIRWNNSAKIWDAQTGQPLYDLVGHTDQINSALFSPDGKYIVTASLDKTVKVWDAATGKLIDTLEGHGYAVKSAIFSQNCKEIVTASADLKTKIWDVNRHMLGSYFIKPLLPLKQQALLVTLDALAEQKNGAEIEKKDIIAESHSDITGLFKDIPSHVIAALKEVYNLHKNIFDSSSRVTNKRKISEL